VVSCFTDLHYSVLANFCSIDTFPEYIGDQIGGMLQAVRRWPRLAAENTLETRNRISLSIAVTALSVCQRKLHIITNTSPSWGIFIVSGEADFLISIFSMLFESC
jgi:hypothetical protein